MKNKLIIIFFLSGFWCLNGAQDLKPKSNFEIFSQISTQCVQEILDAHLPKTVKKVSLQGVNSADSLNWFLENILFNLLNRQGIDSILIQPKSGAAVFNFKNTILIKFSIISLDLNYETESHWRITNKSTVNRHFDVHLFFQIIDEQNGTILWSGEGSRQYMDQVNQKQISKLESKSIQFTRAKFHHRSVYSRFIEPVIVIATTGTIIYLFYAFRSQ